MMKKNSKSNGIERKYKTAENAIANSITIFNIVNNPQTPNINHNDKPLKCTKPTPSHNWM
jgi:hypothetical protein